MSPPVPRRRWGPVPPRVALTAGWLGSVIDGDDEGRLLRDAAPRHPAHVLARIGRRHLRDAQAGARHLGGDNAGTHQHQRAGEGTNSG